MSHPKIARPDHDVIDVIRNRWSPRAFDPARAIAQEDLLRLFEAARWAPSSLNEQPWRFVVIERATAPDQFASLVGALTGRNPMWAGAAPAFVVVAVREALERHPHVNRHACYDAGQAVGFLALQATAMGLSVRQMEGFDQDKTREICQVPAGFETLVVMAIGYAGDPSRLEFEKHRDAEQEPRKRRAIAEFVFRDKWGTTFSA